jgi:hypothetical protein
MAARDLPADVELVEPTGFGIILHLALHGLPFKIFTLARSSIAEASKPPVWSTLPTSPCSVIAPSRITTIRSEINRTTDMS